MDEELNILFSKLKNIILNFKKAPNRRYTNTHLTNIVKSNNKIYTKILGKLVDYSVDEYSHYKKKATELSNEIKEIVEQKQNSEIISFKATATAVIFTKRLEKYRNAKMTTILEIVKTIPSLIPQYNGDGEKLNSIIAALNACKVLINNDNRAVAIQVILSRFEGKARSAVGDNPQTVDAIIESLNRKCKTSIAPETVVAKLNATKQTGDIVKFTEQIEKLTMDLERAYISEEIPVDTALRMAVKAGVKALAAGVRNSETRLLLKAGQFNTLSAAVEKITENESAGSNSSTSQIMYARRGGYPRGRGNYQSRGRGNNRRGHNSRGNYQNYNREQNHAYHHRGNGRSRGRGMNHNTYYVQTQNPPQNINHQMPPQQGQPQQQFVQQTQNVPNNGNIHPLGVPLRQHTQ